MDRIAFSQPTEEPCCLGVSLIQVRDDIEVGLDHKAAMFDDFGWWRDLRSTEDGAAK